jgi:small-conductance mechanosensitive channel
MNSDSVGFDPYGPGATDPIRRRTKSLVGVCARLGFRIGCGMTAFLLAASALAAPAPSPVAALSPAGAPRPAGPPPAAPAPAHPLPSPATPSAASPAAAASSPSGAAPASNASAAAPFDAAAEAQALSVLSAEIPTVEKDADLAALGVKAAAIEAAADKALFADNQALGALAKRLPRGELRRHRRLPAAEAQKLDALLAQRESLEAAAAEARATALNASRAFSLIAQRRREGFSTRVLERTASPLTPDFWASLRAATGQDLSRVKGMAQRILDVAERAPMPRAPVGMTLSLAAALILAWPARRWLEGIGRRRLLSRPAIGSTRRTLRAIWVACIDVGAPTLAAAMVHLGAQWSNLLAPSANAILGAVVGAVAWGAAILALGRVMATDRESAMRLLTISDQDAARIRRSLWPVAVVTGAGFVIRQFNYTIGASVPASIAANCVLSLAYAAAAAAILLSVGARTAEADAPSGSSVQGEGSGTVARSPAWTLISLTLSLAIGATVLAVLTGYTTLAALVSGQMFWLSLLGGVTYLLVRLVDDVFSALFRPDGRPVQQLTAVLGLHRSTIVQAGLLMSAGLQLLVLFSAASLALTPYGQSGELLFSHFRDLGGAIHLGKATISPSAVAAGLATFAVGMALVHVVRNWVTRRYLPITDWDSGVRNSVTTGVGYLGVGVALLSAFAVMGLSFQQIALIASALSVGIGFGLQQIVQNFVAGIILLIERPVKIGDWVNVGGVEGDVRRIRVRATEIQSFDRSVVIVPNSNLITMNVQNKTLGEAHGRIFLPVTVAKLGDADKAAELIKAAAAAQSDVLGNPEPKVLADSFAAGGGVTFNCYFYVATPRDAARIRSELMFRIIADLVKNEVSIL